MQSEIRTIIGGAAFILLFGVVSVLVIKGYAPEASQYSEGSWACTTDVFVCTDGTTVGRTPPYCQFASCPHTN